MFPVSKHILLPVHDLFSTYSRKSIIARNTSDLKHAVQIRRRMIRSSYTFITLCVLYTFVVLKHAASAAPRLDTRPHIPCGIIALHPRIDRFSVSPFASHHSTLFERRQAGETGADEQERKGPSRCEAETKST